MRPVICMITDRRRERTGNAEALVARVRAAARAGVDLIQVRERDLEGRALADLVARCVAAVRDTRARILVNDRLDVALASGAHGVHLRADSFAADRVRAMVPVGFLVGRSVHDVDEARAASNGGRLDYLIFGTVFPSRSKPSGHVAAGVAVLADVVQATAVPVLAVGGIDAVNVSEVTAVGAAGVAAIDLFAGSARPETSVAAIVRAFDTPRPGSYHGESHP